MGSGMRVEKPSIPYFCKKGIFADYLIRKRGIKEKYASIHVGLDTPWLPGGSF